MVKVHMPWGGWQWWTSPSWRFCCKWYGTWCMLSHTWLDMTTWYDWLSNLSRVDMVNIPWCSCFFTSQVVGLGISEPSTLWVTNCGRSQVAYIIQPLKPSCLPSKQRQHRTSLSQNDDEFIWVEYLKGPRVEGHLSEGLMRKSRLKT